MHRVNDPPAYLLKAITYLIGSEEYLAHNDLMIRNSHDLPSCTPALHSINEYIKTLVMMCTSQSDSKPADILMIDRTVEVWYRSIITKKSEDLGRMVEIKGRKNKEDKNAQ